MKIEYLIIIIGIILAFVIGGIKNLTYEEPIYFGTFDINQSISASLWNNITIDCEMMDINLVYENGVVEVCEYFKQKLKGEEKCSKK